jgi:hypothetical protein
MVSVLSLLPLLTAGQAFGSVTLTVNNQKDFSFGPELCHSSLGAEWLPTLRGTPCSSLALWVTPGECRDTFADGDLVLPEVTAANLIQMIGGVVPANVVRIPVDALPLFQQSEADGGMGCGVLGVEHAYRFCSAVSMSLDLGCVTQTVVKGSPASLTYDTKPPGAPQVVSAEALDQSITVGFSVDSDARTVIVQVRGPQDEGFADAQTVTTDVSTATVENLVNDTPYTVRVVAVDAIGNASDPSEELELTPRLTVGFWGACREAGCPNPECSAVGGLPLAALALLLLFAGRVLRAGT